jgi:hypothetical protein
VRRIRHRSQPDYIVPIGQKLGTAVALSGRANIVLERTWSVDQADQIDPYVHVRWNVSALEGLQIVAGLKRNGDDTSAKVLSAGLYKIDQSTWQKTLVLSPTMIASGLQWTVAITQSQLSANELSGAETYFVTVEIMRRRRKFFVSAYFNHLGCFDSIYRLQQAANHMHVMKGDT